MVNPAQAVPMRRRILTIQPTAELQTVADIQVTAAIAGVTDTGISQYPQDITETEKTAPLVPTSLLAQHIQAAAVQATAVLTVLIADIV